MSRVVFGVVALAIMFLNATSPAAERAPINTSLKALAGAYAGSWGLARARSETVGIGPDGRVSLKMPWGMYERRFLGGKITYFSPAGFVVKFKGMQGPVEMRFVFQKGFPKSFFRDDGAYGVSAFTRI